MTTNVYCLGRRLLVGFFALATVALLPLGQVGAKGTYPSQPIRLIVPWGAGGGTDSYARVLAQELGQLLNQTIVVENTPGASGMIGAARVSRADPDGYTLLFNTNAHVINPALRKSIQFDSVKDFTPVGIIGFSPNMLVVRADSPYQNAEHYIEAARKSPGAISYASAGFGTSTHLVAEQLSQATKTMFNHIPFNSTSKMTQAVLAGDVESMWLGGATIQPYLKEGRLRVLGTANSERSRFAPEAQTFGQMNISGLNSATWFGLFGPAGLPSDVVTRLNEALKTLHESPAFSQRMLAAGMDRLDLVPASEMKDVMVREIEMYQKLVRDTGIPLLD